VDRTAAGALADTLAHFAELEDWASVTLADVAKHSNLIGDRFGAMCTCGADVMTPSCRTQRPD